MLILRYVAAQPTNWKTSDTSTLRCIAYVAICIKKEKRQAAQEAIDKT